MVTNNKNPTDNSSDSPAGQRSGKQRFPKPQFDYSLLDQHDFMPSQLQTTFYEEAKKQNIIICLENDVTKTLVSIMIIDYFANKTKSINGESPQKILVVESTEQTIDQRINLILSNVDLKGLTLKKENFANLDEQQFKRQFESVELVISASDIATQLFDNGLVKIDEFCLIIFHDIHQNFDNLNNLRIMHHYEQAERKPRILGFCISLINNESTTKRMNALIRKMEINFHSKCKAAICTYNNKPKEIIIRIKPTSLDLMLNNEFRSAFSLLSSLVKFLDKSKIKPKNTETSTIHLKSARKFLHTFIYVIEELGIWPAKKLAELYINELAELASVNITADKNYASALSALNSLFNYLRALLNALLKNYNVHEQFYELSSSKLRCLVSTLSENLAESSKALELFKPDKDRRMNKKIQTAQFSCIIFAKKKEVVRVLAAYLYEISTFDIQGCFNLKPESIVCEKRIAKNFEELKPNKKQEEIIAKFKKLEYNTLVITSSIEEMLDIPKCNLVIRFDLPTSSKEYIQSKERTRLESNKLIFIVNEGTNDEEKLLEFVRQEKILMEKFKSNSGDVEEERKLRELGVDLEQVENQIASFKPKNKKTARAASTSISIAVINRYCSKLPSDSFTKLFPRWKLNERIDEETGYKLYQCELNLPINSPIRYEIRGDFVLTKKLAKKSAAINACQKLYECGELDEYLLPICKENIKCIDNEVELIGEEPNTDANGRNLAGTTKKRRYYNKKTADILTGESLSANKGYHLYIFTMRLTCPIPEEQNTRGRKIIDPADHPRNFGLLMRNKLPKICKFPVFTRSGEVLVDIKRVPTKTQLDEPQFERLVNFHKFTFKDVLLLEKYPMKFDYANSNSTYLVVPIDYDVKQPDEKLAQAKLDWHFVGIVEGYQDKLQNGGYLKAGDLANKNRPKFEFRKELYEDAVIKPLYHKNDLHFYFYVAEIFENLNPLSPFTNDKYETFADYFKIKYNTELTNLTQPLLDVDYTSARLNLLTPRYVNRKGVTLPMSTAKTKIEIRNNLEKKQLLIPEICILHPFPASFWKKAVCLPSLLYRLNCLLLADELRKEVAISVNIGKIELNEDESWPPLDFGWTLADVLKGCSDKCNLPIESLELSSAPPVTNASVSSKPKALANEATGKAAGGRSASSAKQKQTAVQEEKKSAAASILNQPSEPLGDYVIDVFDPTKYEIKDIAEDDDSDDPEMEQDYYKNFLSSNNMFNSKNTFDLNPQSAFPVEQMFNATFSFKHPDSAPNGQLAIENDQLNWTEHNRFLNCGMGGLTSISGLENFNMKSLSEDIAKINEVDDVDLIGNFDSDEDVSSGPEEVVEDEEDAEFDLSYKPKNSFFSKPSFVQDEYMYEIQTNGLMSDNRLADSQQSELTNICNNLKEEELEQDQIVQQIDLSYFEIKSFVETTGEQANAIVEDQKQPPKSSRLKLTEITRLLKDAIGFDELADNANKIKSTKSVDKKANKEQEENFQPGFGELLPIKKPSKGDEQKKKSAAKPDEPEKPTFDVKFDPYEDDQKDCLGPDPSMILQAITMSNASDCINLERLETVGDSFLKYAVTAYLYCTYEKIHEGKLSHLRSKQISNYNLFRLGKNKCLGDLMVATKFEPSDNWLPPGFVIPKGLEQVLVDLSMQNSANAYDLNALKHLSLDNLSESELRQEIEKLKTKCIISSAIKDAGSDDESGERSYENAMAQITKKNNTRITDLDSLKDATHIPYNLSTQHSIPDKSIADCVESLIGAYLISCGTKSALLFMKWLGLKVLQENANQNDRGDGRWHWLPKIESPLVLSENIENYAQLNEADRQAYLKHKTDQLDQLFYGSNLDRFEKEILCYEFKDKSYLVQAFTHNSYYDNRITDCYQRLEFLGDAVLDFLITRYLFEDPAKHSPGTLTDLRSALVNNTFFASLAVKYDFQKYIKISSADLIRVITKFVNKVNKDESFINSATFGLCIEEGESENLEDVQVPKALGDVFESVAGAIYLDSDLSLDAVWQVYFRMMRPEIEYFSKNVPKSPIRELLEMKPQNVKFSKPEVIKGKKMSVTVEVFSEGSFVGIGRNRRFAKCTAAKKALRALKAKAEAD